MDELEISDLLGDSFSTKEAPLPPHVLYINGEKRRGTEIIITYNEELESDTEQLNEIELLLMHLRLALGLEKWQKLVELVFNEAVFKRQIQNKIVNRPFVSPEEASEKKEKKKKKNEDPSAE